MAIEIFLMLLTPDILQLPVLSKPALLRNRTGKGGFEPGDRVVGAMNRIFRFGCRVLSRFG
jgi:hypothetical protein